MTTINQYLSNPSILKNAQILVVDNDADSRYLYRILFEDYSARVTTIESVTDALVLLDWFTPDILICEIRFLGENATALIQRVRAIPLYQNQRIPILIASASCSVSFAQNLIAMVEYHLLKPVDIGYLVNAVQNLIHLSKVTSQVNMRANKIA